MSLLKTNIAIFCVALGVGYWGFMLFASTRQRKDQHGGKGVKLTIHIEAEDPNACIEELLSASLKSSPKWSILLPAKSPDIRIVEVDKDYEQFKDVLKLAQRVYSPIKTVEEPHVYPPGGLKP